MSTKWKIVIAALIIFLAAATRLIDHPYNFTPIIAMSIFGGCYLHKRWGVLIPFAAMALSDVILYSNEYGWSMFNWKTTLAVYAGVGLAFFIGWQIKKRLTWYFTLGGALVASLAFFFITNFSVWAFFDWYPHTLAGLTECFTLALPFFRNSLAGDMVYTGLLFGVYEMALYASSKKIASETAVIS